jgi:GGDEF domain-containing protein
VFLANASRNATQNAGPQAPPGSSRSGSASIEHRFESVRDRSASFGVAVWRRRPCRALVAAADVALYESKPGGRNRAALGRALQHFSAARRAAANFSRAFV